MTAPATIAAIRFGFGLAQGQVPPANAAALLADLAGADQIAARFPVQTFAGADAHAQGYLLKQRAARGVKGTGNAPDPQAVKALKAAKVALAEAYQRGAATTLARAVAAPVGFRERLVWFWADHFTVRSKTTAQVLGPLSYVDDAIRPHVAGRFTDMLVAAALHPVMLIYLDQTGSYGPNSPFALRHKRGLNENLAREVLELHSLGVDGTYDQDDVRSFANLLTGLTYSSETGFEFRPKMAEPGAEVVLGKSYGGDGPARLEDVTAALHDIALHPDTAHHIARKLAVHFVADDPDPGLVSLMAAAYAATNGDLSAVYAAMLNDAAAWALPFRKVRQPMDFMAAALRGLGVAPQRLLNLPARQVKAQLVDPLQVMGQPFQQPTGPNGWPEEAEAWVTPAGLAARIQWAMTAPSKLEAELPDPRAMVTTALADAAGPDLVLAAERAESIPEGIGIILASPEFNRR